MLIIAVLILVVAQATVPRRLALLPLLIATFHLPNTSVLAMGGGNFPITRLLICVALVRTVLTRDLVWSRRNPLDLVIGIWSGCALISSFAHNDLNGSPLVYRLGLIFNVAGIYLYTRSVIKDSEDFFFFTKCLAGVLTSQAIFMVLEHFAARNPYAIFAGVNPDSLIRNGEVRAMGPFAHAILAGTAATSSLGLILAAWKRHRLWVIAGSVACVVTTLSSGSSGPVMTFVFVLVGLAFWPWRTRMRTVRWVLLLTLLLLHMLMKAPVWYLPGRIDLTGSSTGWHRSQLIDSSLRHLNEWWLFGTDRTRHWMPTGVSWSPDHTDITNYYLAMGVDGGLPLMLSLIAILMKSFQMLGARMAQLRRQSDPLEFSLWAVGATLFAHVMTFFSVSYFDQTGNLFYIAVGLLPGLCGPNRAMSKVRQYSDVLKQSNLTKASATPV